MRVGTGVYPYVYVCVKTRPMNMRKTEQAIGDIHAHVVLCAQEHDAYSASSKIQRTRDIL